MPVSSLDHINIRTENLKMTEFYAKVLGMKGSALPSNLRRWLYCGNRAAVASSK